MRFLTGVFFERSLNIGCNSHVVGVYATLLMFKTRKSVLTLGQLAFKYRQNTSLSRMSSERAFLLRLI